MASHGDTTESQSMNGSLAEGHRAYKSFKRKFAKLKIKFEQAMKEGNSLVKEELRIIDLSRRLKEQNDQLLELLLELNSSIRIPRHLRYSLSIPGELFSEACPPEPGTPPTPSFDAATARQKLREARVKLLEGKMSAVACRLLEESIARSDNFAPALHYSELIKTPHTMPSNGIHSTVDGDLDSTLGFLSPEHDMEYTNKLDSGLGFTRTGDRPLTAEREREIIMRNPTSMYNWLRKNDPNAFQDTESIGASEKPSAPSKAAATRTSKRAAAQAPKEEKIFEDDSFMLDLEPEVSKGSNRTKRKRDEDGGYRPKGGSGRSRKKKEDGTKRKRPAVASAS
ncbi:hypothetical protein D8B26_001236 [Coccidioides posadasii str. Silveira]|uniref:Uncharacterized protein n=3 Tax=Coccidioides posadasii TaxID=199306 RepID=E9DA74_COCPS|nr:hypothetical protein CPC735_045290 [Coccidioides posadasii C735 delta SOWgp]EER23159.1 hypothetical protein CPC735_045290 [Coccidioides posadasii C735 delta SOWgp]EFW16805.1 conserved hypothetical protein [Coccidioides posadasii str. Silveira]KMM64429.1 hypothetical protein CPAG_00781 [Coccidioides posadasii RMSCC 3488]QVM06528.1 hypothetical protein D8B26_001236 [Coccidioides posadasii str. Silveira]|eukprot:XP_003065304.1 hypothetical protein CPC735_045290 [Coccidioides posadasii C735 delta SOWgp]